MYYIYHIPGIKVGCTANLEKRTTQNRWYHSKKFSNIIILETVTSVAVADILEYYWHKELDYGIIPPNERYTVRYSVAQRNIGREVSQSTKDRISKAKKGKCSKSNNSQYHKGRIIVELTSNPPVSGSVTDMAELFGYDAATIGQFAKRGTPLRSGRNKGLHFQVYEEK